MPPSTRQAVLTFAVGALALAPLRAPDLPEQRLPILGGTGGDPFARSCGADRVLTGFRYRAGLVVDAIGLQCRPVNADGSLGAETTVGSLAGGSGGTAGFKSCPVGSVLGRATIYYGTYVDGIRLVCRAWDKSTRSMGAFTFNTLVGRGMVTNELVVACEAATQPMVAIRGRASGVVDAIGMTCNEP
jgi:hypothetical protein